MIGTSDELEDSNRNMKVTRNSTAQWIFKTMLNIFFYGYLSTNRKKKIYQFHYATTKLILFTRINKRIQVCVLGGRGGISLYFCYTYYYCEVVDGHRK